MINKNVPFFSLQKQTQLLEKEFSHCFEELLKSQQFIGGNAVVNFEKNLAQLLKTKHVISCNSGTDALWLALKALDIQKESIVLTTPFSFIASSSEIVAHGAYPVFIDIDAKTFNLDPKLLQKWLKQEAKLVDGKAVHKKTNLPISGIVTVDLYGQCCDYKKIRAIADTWNLWIVEDAAQAIGASVNNKQAGTLGDIATFSFYPTKNVGALGDAGCCITNDDNLAKRLSALKNHGRAQHYEYQEVGINSRLDSLQASLLSVKLKHLDQWTTRRREIAKLYYEQLGSCSWLELPQEIDGKHVYHRFTVKVLNGKRDSFIEYLTKNGIGSQICYPKSFTQMPFLNSRADLVQACPVVETIVNQIVSLPLFPELTDEQITYVCKTIKKFKKTIVKKPLQQQTVFSHAA